MRAFFITLLSLISLQLFVARALTELHLVPHTHADVGWLQTLDSLSRVNVSRILNGVTGNLHNDTLKRRRFVWDEMAFLQKWWDDQATTQQQEIFKTLVKEGRIEFVDNGWSQHDMGCTTVDTMLNNWMEGHSWLAERFGAGARPKVGWSLDPFGISGSQAVLQALAGMEAWFFTRIDGDIVNSMKESKGLEFVWRASSSLPDEESEIFAHVLESYYCLPLPTFAFEWGPAKGAKIPSTPKSTLALAKQLADIAKERGEWFRTEHVMIPWGCDYMYQNSELMFSSTDKLIDAINEHSEEWGGVHVQYSTPSEYLSAVRTSAKENKTKFPVKRAGSSFFPYQDWSGYFTSRPALKGLNTVTHAALNAAEQLFALHGSKNTAAENEGLYKMLENARRLAGIVQHHDSITGTMCVAKEGCAGTDQVVGPHNVLSDYKTMLQNATDSAREVSARLLGDGQPLSWDIERGFGDVLMGRGGDGGDDAFITVYNPLAINRTEVVHVPVPICAVTVFSMDNSMVTSQVTAQFSISSGEKPFYDFELAFEAVVPPLSTLTFRVSPSPADAGCGGGDASIANRHFVRHEPVVPSPETCKSSFGSELGFNERVLQRAKSKQTVSGNLDEWNLNMKLAHDEEIEQCMNGQGRHYPPDPYYNGTAVLENEFLKVIVDTAHGIKAVVDKKSTPPRYVPLTHDLMQYGTFLSSKRFTFVPLFTRTPVFSKTNLYNT